VPRTPQRSIFGRIAAAILGGLIGSGADPDGSTRTSARDGSARVLPSTNEYWEGVASDPDDYENSVENLDTVEDDELGE
jgi:hypothetical protein